MKNMKKALCLIMAMVFVLGLCTVGAGAATELKDAASIGDVYKNAVTVMSGLGIIAGYPDGTFQPTKNVTRAEAAKLVTYMVLGAKNAERVPDGDGGFSDVAGNWASKYINYCASRGYIKGMGDGTFNPNGNIKGTELAALLLRVAGYGVMGEYEGKGWDINAVSHALAYGIYGDSEAEDFGAPATREETVLYFFNTMTEVIRVSYDVDLNDYVTTGVNAGSTFGRAVWNLNWFTDQIVANQATGEDYTKVDSGVGYWYTPSGSSTPVWITTSTNFKIDTGLDEIAHKVKIWYRDELKTDANNTNYYDAYMVEDLSTVATKGTYEGDLYKTLAAANKAGNNAKTLSSVEVWVNYEYDSTGIDIGAHTAAAGDTFASLQGNFTTTLALSGDLILDENGVALAVMKKSIAIAEVASVTDDGVTLVKDAFGQQPYPAYEGVKKGDFVTIYKYGKAFEVKPNTTKDIDIFEVGAYGTFNLGSFFGGPEAGSYVDDVTPPGSFTATHYHGLDTKVPQESALIKPGDTARFYMDAEGKYYGVELLAAGTDAGRAYLSKGWDNTVYNEYNEDTVVHYAQVVDADGNEVIYKTTALYTTPGVYDVRVSASTGKATLTAYSEVGAFTRGEFKKQSGKSSYVTETDNTGAYYISKDTKIFYVNYSTAGKASTIEITKGSLRSGSYNVFASLAPNKRDINTIWITAVAAQPDTAGSYMYVGGYGQTYGNYKTAGGSMVVGGEPTNYFSVYIDGEQNYSAYIAYDASYYFPGFDNIINAGLYKYSTKDVDGSTVYTLDGPYGVNKTLKEGAIHNGKLYDGADGVDISGIKVVNATGEKSLFGTKDGDGKNFFTIETIADLESLLVNYDLQVQYVPSSSNGKPVTPIYVSSVLPKS